MNARVGFIGGGKMAEALIESIIASNKVKSCNINVSDVSEERLEYLKQKFGVNTFILNTEVVALSDIIILAVKPQVMTAVLEEIKDAVIPQQLIVSIAAGYPIENIEKLLGKDKKIIRVMPNILVKVSEGTMAFSPNINVSDEEVSLFKGLFSVAGEVIKVEEKLMDAVTGLSGSGPAFVFLVIEALADGGVRTGLPRDIALKLAAQTVKGSAEMVLRGEHPEVLKDSVISPAGTTAEGIAKLEEKGVRSAFIEAVFAAFRRSKEISELIKKW
ncbi:pyrroline-5-carboxylate reductase [Desulfurobacterium indicum]|nr:pyrroline-5-carboxylate reductase [Desulfurobacterium indicum]